MLTVNPEEREDENGDRTLKKLGFGSMRLPLINPEDPGSVDLAHVSRMVDLYLERGFRYFDTAYPYHAERSEDALRQCLTERYPRESYLLADKMPILRVTYTSCIIWAATAIPTRNASAPFRFS